MWSAPPPPIEELARGREMSKRILFTRPDGKWTWRLEADEDGILATDGGPGFESEAEARAMADRIISGVFRDAEKKVVRRPKPFDQRFVENIANDLRIQAGAKAVAASESLHIPVESVPPGLSEAERQFWSEWWEDHDPRPRQTPNQLGPWNVPINFSGATAVGGFVELIIRRDGSWNFSGGLRGLGLPSCDAAVVFVVKHLGTDEMYQFGHQGRIHGTLHGGSHDDSWDESGFSSELVADWDALFIDGYHWHCRAGIDIGIDSLTDAAQRAVGEAATIIAFV